MMMKVRWVGGRKNEVWQQILEIDPYNKLAYRNIAEAEARLRKIEELGISE